MGYSGLITGFSEGIDQTEVKYALVEVFDELVLEVELEGQVAGDVVLHAGSEVYAYIVLVPVYDVGTPVGQGDSGQRIDFELASQGEEVVYVDVEVPKVEAVVFEEIVEGSFQADGVGEVILVFGSDGEAFDFCTVAKLQTYGLLALLGISGA